MMQDRLILQRAAETMNSAVRFLNQVIDWLVKDGELTFGGITVSAAVEELRTAKPGLIDILEKCSVFIADEWQKIENNKLTFKRSYKYRCDHADEDIAVLLDVVHNRNNLPEDISVYHSGRCGCCGRVLTDPEAISRGFGPECWKKVKDHI